MTSNNTESNKNTEEQIDQQAPKRPISPSQDFENKKVRSKAPTSAEIGEYIIDGDLRRVKPYEYTFSTYVKGRWLNRTILEVFQTEFHEHTPEYYEKSIEVGKITVNNKQVPKDFKLINGQVVKHKVHRHEPPVKKDELDIIQLTDDLVVVDKPCSIAVHPSGRYHFNTLKHILEADHNINKFYAINRLDRLTSGIVLIARNSIHAHKMEQLMKSRLIQKLYLTLVNGKFPNFTQCNEPLKTTNFKLAINEVHPDGKESSTLFKLINYNKETDTSLVLCKPLTGRTHQIRVHLQYLGFPIVNDPHYNTSYKAELELKKKELAPTKGVCEECNWEIMRDPEDFELSLNLHAFEYNVSGEIYRSKKLPKWADGLTCIEDIINIKFDEDNNENGKDNDDKESKLAKEEKIVNEIKLE